MTNYWALGSNTHITFGAHDFRANPAPTTLGKDGHDPRPEAECRRLLATITGPRPAPALEPARNGTITWDGANAINPAELWSPKYPETLYGPAREPKYDPNLGIKQCLLDRIDFTGRVKQLTVESDEGLDRCKLVVRGAGLSECAALDMLLRTGALVQTEITIRSTGGERRVSYIGKLYSRMCDEFKFEGCVSVGDFGIPAQELAREPVVIGAGPDGGVVTITNADEFKKHFGYNPDPHWGLAAGPALAQEKRVYAQGTEDYRASMVATAIAEQVRAGGYDTREAREQCERRLGYLSQCVCEGVRMLDRRRGKTNGDVFGDATRAVLESMSDMLTTVRK